MKAARVSRPCPRHRGKLLALLAAAVALTGGAQALVPAPAAAMVNEGEECDPSLPSSDCEPNNGGGGDGSGGGGQSGDGAPIVGEETIEIHDTPPLPCVVNPSACLPREPGGRSQGVQADRGPRQPRRGPKPYHMSEPSPVDWRTICKAAIDAAEQAQLELNYYLRDEFRDMSLGQRFRQRAWRSAVDKLKSRRERLREWLPALRATQRASAQVDEMESVLLGLEVELVEASEALDTGFAQMAHMHSLLNSLEKDVLFATERKLECKYQWKKPSRSELPPSDGDK